MASIDGNGKGIALVVDEHGKLIATVTDGDIRRAILAGISLPAPIRELVRRKQASPCPRPVTARVELGSSEEGRAALLELMRERAVRQIPLLDSDGRVVDLVTLDELLPRERIHLEALVMAGGRGERLHPLTEEVPKPMLPVGNRPLLERILEQLRAAGIRRVKIATQYRPEKITEHFGDGREFGLEIRYLSEDRPLGTAGALGLMEAPKDPLLVVNGDILTRVDFRAMFRFHREHHADLTVATRQYDLQVPFGVVECDGPHVRGFREKPVAEFMVNAGIYLLEPEVHASVPRDRHFDMTELIETLIAADSTVVSFPVVEYWVDIGEHASYHRVQDDLKSGRLSL
ncbi:MAG: NTP transferase domain-containing protein [bacterium]|nr:NTP transferase domain-containing protein [bacterium]